MAIVRELALKFAAKGCYVLAASNTTLRERGLLATGERAASDPRKQRRDAANLEMEVRIAVQSSDLLYETVKQLPFQLQCHAHQSCSKLQSAIAMLKPVFKANITDES